MTISSVAELYSYSGYIKSISDSSAVKRVSDITSVGDSGTIEKLASQDEKTGAVLNSNQNSNNAVVYDFRFLPNIPLSKTSETDKSYNETKKTNKKESDQKSFSYFISNSKTEESASRQENTGKGYYIVLSDQTPPPKKKTSFTSKDLFQERINNTYHLSRMRGNGTLVNLTF